MKQSKFPKAWDDNKVQAVLAHYENQSGEDAVLEDELASKVKNINAKSPRRKNGKKIRIYSQFSVTLCVFAQRFFSPFTVPSDAFLV